MKAVPDYASWLIEEADHAIRRKASVGLAHLSAWERALYCLWVADYSMRNAGDLQAAYDLEPDFKRAGLQAAHALHLPETAALFGLEDCDFVLRYLASFDAVCRELADSRRAV